MNRDEVTVQSQPIALDDEARSWLGQAYAFLIELGRRAREQHRATGAPADDLAPAPDAPATEPKASVLE
ncbi:MAG: hypothetical protein KKA73_30455 [Chloroflexi bacterium]|nr:hypothetical protein [Chloroflexota bacterium]MBU1752022.1 hypothetical protein [Chloroflexota bacterium]